MKKYVGALAFFLFLFSLDLWTKMAALESLPPLSGSLFPFGGKGIFAPSFGVSFSLNLVTNRGAAWGLFSHFSDLLFLLRVGIIFGLSGYLLFFDPKRGVEQLPLWLVVTGAVGNTADYLLYGHVIDFFHFTFFGKSFPLFNLADSYITIGVLLLFLLPRWRKRAPLVSD